MDWLSILTLVVAIGLPGFWYGLELAWQAHARKNGEHQTTKPAEAGSEGQGA